MNHDANDNRTDGDRPVTGDRLDQLLRSWHDENRAAAEAMRGEILRGIAADRDDRGARGVIGRIGFLRTMATAALLALAVLLAILFVSSTEKEAVAESGIVQVAEGGALDALDADGNSLGPCPLQRTEVKVEISGLFARTIVEQTYANPYPRTIEAVYTFPLSSRAAVDRMTMVVRGESGEKVIEGEVKERSLARAIYEEARESGYVASLLEQERPNIFTQSVANIEPGATVKVRIATVELAQRRDGVAEYVFPMVVGPRYIPGASAPMPTLPTGWEIRAGVVLRAPAGVEIDAETPFPAGRMLALLEAALPVRSSKPEAVDELMLQGEGIRFSAKYGNGSAERGRYFPARGLGEINGRFFHAISTDEQGTGFAGDTDRVPDASRITPMPVKPTERAGHDIGISVSIDSGGPAITDVSSELHAIDIESTGATTRTIALEDRRTIPNRDFILRWKVADAAIEPSFFAHVSSSPDPVAKGGYFTLVIEPPARVAPAEIRPRELVFVLDTSGSMSGFPIEKSKALARKAIAAMRANDTFNVITFAGATSVLWPEPKPATDENRRLAEQFVDGTSGSGGTEMMAAIDAALVQDGRSGMAAARLLELPADGRPVRVAVPHGALAAQNGFWSLAAGGDRAIRVDLPIAIPANPRKLALIVDGAWITRDGERVLAVRDARFEREDARTRLVFFLTDGYIGNDQAVVAAVRDNARASRVFSFGIGNSVNRFLLEEMARAGRGTCEIVTLAEEADAVIERLTRRIESPVLTDLELDVPASLGIRDLLPGGEHLPDLYDQEPIVLMGRFDRAASGVITIRGRTGAGAWEKSIVVALPEAEPRHDVVPTLWARAKVDEILRPKIEQVEAGTLDGATKREVVRLGETFRIATPYTSFVAVEKSRVVVGGKAMLVGVPVELPDGTNWEGFFGESAKFDDAFAFEPAAAVQFYGDVNASLRMLAPSEPAAGAPMDAAKSKQAPMQGARDAAGASMAKRQEAQQSMRVDTKSVVVPSSAPPNSGGVFGGAGRPPAPPATTWQPSRQPGGVPGAPPASASPPPPTLTGGFGGGGGGTGGGFAQSNTSGTEKSEALSRFVREAESREAEEAAPPAADPAPSGKPTIDRDRFVRVFELRLLVVALTSLFDAGRLDESIAEQGLAVRDGQLEVVLLLETIDAAARKSLVDAGFTIDAEIPERKTVVGRIAGTRLAKLADIPVVRRAEGAVFTAPPKR